MIDWVSDITWADVVDYDAESGQGSLGVEFAVTAVTSDGYGELNNTHSNAQSRDLIRDNPALHWAEGYYRGYLEISVHADRVDARFYGSYRLCAKSGSRLTTGRLSLSLHSQSVRDTSRQLYCRKRHKPP